MQLQGTITERDVVVANKLHARLWPFWLYTFGSLALAVYLWLVCDELPLALLLLVVNAGLWFRLLVLLPSKARRLYREYKALSAPVTIAVQDEGLDIQQPNRRGLILWQEIRKWRQSDQVVLLYMASNVFHIIPAHFCNDRAEFDALCELLTKRLGPSR